MTALRTVRVGTVASVGWGTIMRIMLRHPDESPPGDAWEPAVDPAGGGDFVCQASGPAHKLSPHPA